MDTQKNDKLHSVGIEVNGLKKELYLQPEGTTSDKHRIYLSDDKTIAEILESVDSLCTKYYKLDMKDVFKDFNRVYYSLRKLK